MDSRGPGFREIDHTADLGFEVWAPTREELIRQATVALMGFCCDRKAVRPSQRRALRVVASDPEAQLVDWLQEIYLLLETERWLTTDAEDLVCSECGIEGIISGEPYDSSRHIQYTEIKAITYHQLEVCREPDGLWRAQVVVDV